jgi:hypothetical protein
VSIERKAESGERRGNKNSNLDVPKINKNMPGIFQNLPIIVKKLDLFPWDV